MSQSNKTEKATPRREHKAREQGRVARSREIPAAMTLLSVVITLWLSSGKWAMEWHRLFEILLSGAGSRSSEEMLITIRKSALVGFSWAAPSAVVGCAVALGATIVQGGMVFAPAALEPKFARFNPFENVRKLASIQGLKNALKAILPTSVLVYVLTGVIVAHWQEFQFLEMMPAGATLSWFLTLMFEAAWKGGLVFLAWSSLDYLLERFHFAHELRMSKDEVREESKEMEGNPQIKGRMRRLQRRMRRQRMAKSIATATVVITNPTEFAVALRYVPQEMDAPVLVAKGQNLLAAGIRRAAIWNGVPIVENPPLARAIYRSVEIDQQIPAKLYVAVAEILAFIHRAHAGNRATS